MDLLKDSLNGSVAAFELMGRRSPLTALSARPNLFQNIEALDVDLTGRGCRTIDGEFDLGGLKVGSFHPQGESC